jgi:hypothetical protein
MKLEVSGLFIFFPKKFLSPKLPQVEDLVDFIESSVAGDDARHAPPPGPGGQPEGAVDPAVPLPALMSPGGGWRGKLGLMM